MDQNNKQIEIENGYLIRFKKPFMFENTVYTEIDLSGLEDLTGKDLKEAEKQFNASGQIAPVNEISMGYACVIAAMATKQPVNFFEDLPAHEAVKVKTVVMNFFYN